MNFRDEIEDELKSVAPYLASLPKAHPFTVPENYFEEMKLKLISRITYDGNEVNLQFPKENLFTVPDEYFNALPSTILSKIKEQKVRGSEGKTRTISFLSKQARNYRVWLAAASAAIALMVSVKLIRQDHQTNPMAMEQVASELLYASEVDEALVFEMYLQSQQETGDQNASEKMNDENNFLRDVTDIDPNLIYEM